MLMLWLAVNLSMFLILLSQLKLSKVEFGLELHYNTAIETFIPHVFFQKYALFSKLFQNSTCFLGESLSYSRLFHLFKNKFFNKHIVNILEKPYLFFWKNAFSHFFFQLIAFWKPFWKNPSFLVEVPIL